MEKHKYERGKLWLLNNNRVSFGVHCDPRSYVENLLAPYNGAIISAENLDILIEALNQTISTETKRLNDLRTPSKQLRSRLLAIHTCKGCEYGYIEDYDCTPYSCLTPVELLMIDFPRQPPPYPTEEE